MTTPIRTRKVSHVLLHVSDVEQSVIKFCLREQPETTTIKSSVADEHRH